MRYLYLDKANSINDIRVAEMTIWGKIMPQMGFSSFYLLVDTVAMHDVPNSRNEIHIRKRKFPGYYLIDLVQKLSKILRHNQIDTIVIRNAIDLALIAYICKKIFGVRMIYIKAYPALEMKKYERENLRYKFDIKKNIFATLLKFDGAFVNACDHLIARTDRYAQHLRKLYNVKKKILSIPMGIDTDQLIMAENEEKDDLIEQYNLNGRDVLIYFGALSKSRKISFLVETVKKASTVHNNLICFIIGGPATQLAEVRQLVASHGAQEQFILVEALSRDLLFKHIQLCQLSLSPIPPLEEFILSSPTKVVESLALGCPVLANSEIIDQRDLLATSGGGRLVPYSVEEFSREICDMLSNKASLSAMGHRGSKFIREHRSYKGMAESIVSFLERH